MTPKHPGTIAWRSGCDQAALLARAELYRQIRSFFAERGVLEVTTPVLGRSTTTEPGIDSLALTVLSDQPDWYLQPSPEHFMKRLLASGSGDIYQLAPAFRKAEIGRLHNPEFMMLEWYRCGYDHDRLMNEVQALVDHCLGSLDCIRVPYRDLLLEVWQQDIQALAADQQTAFARQVLALDMAKLTPGEALDLLYVDALSRYPAPRFFVTHFPPEQASMATLHQDERGQLYASRFELIIEGVELANGYQEITYSKDQRQRMLQDVETRGTGHEALAPDEKLLAALEAGFPACAGVALGVDRLLMLKLQATSLEEVLTFSVDRA